MPPPKTQTSTLSRAAVPSASSGFATPIGRPSTQAKPPPVPQPLRGPAGAQTVAVAPPRPVQLSRNEQTSRPQATVPKTIQVGTIYFGDGSASLSREDVSIIAAVRQAFGQTGGKIRVVGHSSMDANTLSASRREEVNFRMSLRRANAVADELIRHGVPRQSVEVIAEGDRAPAYEESSRTGAAYNRRTEIFIDY
ncbi:MAG: OmpA family protein [Pseudomonadota bacterium]|nr:OmpA family protein [Pseudomonadota bacterium]